MCTNFGKGITLLEYRNYKGNWYLLINRYNHRYWRFQIFWCNRNVLQTTTKASFELNRIARNRIEFFENDKIAFTYITQEDELKVGAETGDYEGIVDIGRDIEGVEVSIFLREIEKGGYKASLRSNDYVNVSDVCLMFGGGGHIKAAGCTITNGTLEQVRDKIIAQAKLHLK